MKPGPMHAAASQHVTIRPSSFSLIVTRLSFNSVNLYKKLVNFIFSDAEQGKFRQTVESAHDSGVYLDIKHASGLVWHKSGWLSVFGE